MSTVLPGIIALTLKLAAVIPLRPVVTVMLWEPIMGAGMLVTFCAANQLIVLIGSPMKVLVPESNPMESTMVFLPSAQLDFKQPYLTLSGATVPGGTTQATVYCPPPRGVIVGVRL